jgi:TPR repeat protein
MSKVIKEKNKMKKVINNLKLCITGLTLCAVTLLNAATDAEYKDVNLKMLNTAEIDGIVNIDLSENTQNDGSNSSSEKPYKKYLMQGRKKWINGYLDQAINIVQKARNLVPENIKIRKTLKSMQIQKKMIDDALMQTGKLIDQKEFDQAGRTLAKAGYISKKYLPYKEMERRLMDAPKVSLLLQKPGNASNAVEKIKINKPYTPNIKSIDNNIKSGNHNEIDTSGIKEDRKVTQYKKACFLGNGFACYDLAFLYEKGSLVAKNIEKANQLYQFACMLDNNACLAIATYYEAQNNPKKAIYYFDKACETNSKVCKHLAELYETGKYGLDKDLEKAKMYYKKACDLGEKDGCTKYKKMRSN